MSGPPRFITPWAPDSNYATGTGFAWAGTPTKVTPAYVEFQPSPAFAPSAQEMNAMFAARDVVINQLGADAVSGVTLGWQPSQLPSIPASPGPYTTLACVGYDTLTQKWILGGNPGGSQSFLSAGYGDQSGWTAFPQPIPDLDSAGSFRSIIRGNEPGVSSKYLYGIYVTDAASHATLTRIDTTGPTAVMATSPAGSATNVLDCQLATVPGVVIASLGTTLAANSNTLYSTDHGATWTAGFLPAIAVPGWLLQSNPANQVVAIPKLTSNPTYATSPDGTTWTTQAGLSVLGSTEVPRSLCWGDDGTGVGCWVLSTFSASTRLYRSYDGFTWTSITNDLPSGVALDSMVNVLGARVLVALVNETPLARVIYSLNGGAHWSSCRVEAPIVSTVSGVATSHKLTAGPNQVAIACGALLLLSSPIGTAGTIGLP